MSISKIPRLRATHRRTSLGMTPILRSEISRAFALCCRFAPIVGTEADTTKRVFATMKSVEREL